MILGSTLLRNEAARVARVAVELCDAPHLEPAFNAMALVIADCLDGRKAFDVGPLRHAGLEGPDMARALRRLMFASIELFRQRLDESSFSDAVLALRRCVHGAIPRPPADPEDKEFYHHLMVGDREGARPEYRRIVALFEDVALTFRDIIYVHDLNGSLLYVNPPGLALTSYTVEDVVSGLSVYDIIVPEYLDLIEERMETPGAVSRAPYTSEIYAKDGARVPFEVTTRCLLKNHQIAGIVGLARDLRLARRLENELRRTNTLLDNILRHLPVGVVQIDEDATVLDANPAAIALLGHGNAAALIGAPLYLLQEDENSSVHTLIMDAIAYHEVRTAESVELAAGGRCDLTIIPLTFEGKTGASVIVSEMASHGIFE